MYEKETSVVIGHNIRMYRKLRGYTLKSLAEKMNYSLSTLAKYESGEITVSAPMLLRLASVLKVLPDQLLPGLEKEEPAGQAAGSSFFKRFDTYYLYQQSNTYDRLNQLGVNANAMKVIRDDTSSERDEVLYFGVLLSPGESDEKSRYVYKGHIQYHDYLVIIELENLFNKADVAHIYANVPFSCEGKTTGIFVGIPPEYRTPVAGKVIITSTPLEINESLRNELLISSPEVISEIRKHNMLLL